MPYSQGVDEQKVSFFTKNLSVRQTFSRRRPLKINDSFSNGTTTKVY